MSRIIDITGQRFGRLVVAGRAGRTLHRHLKWWCECDCGNNCIVYGSKLRNGHTRSCGCLKQVGTVAFLEAAIASQTDDCVLWPHGKRTRGYGTIGIKGKPYLVHRLVCERVYGHSSLLAIHSCDTPACINPRHLRWGTQGDNMQDMWDRGRH